MYYIWRYTCTIVYIYIAHTVIYLNPYIVALKYLTKDQKHGYPTDLNRIVLIKTENVLILSKKNWSMRKTQCMQERTACPNCCIGTLNQQVPCAAERSVHQLGMYVHMYICMYTCINLIVCVELFKNFSQGGETWLSYKSKKYAHNL